jgi:hypothetical protein
MPIDSLSASVAGDVPVFVETSNVHFPAAFRISAAFGVGWATPRRQLESVG